MPNYDPVDGLKYLMEKKYQERLEDQFPVGTDYVSCFKNIEAYLDEHVHPNINIGAALTGEGLLTDHGAEHVQMVIRNAYYLLRERGIDKLNGCEMFVLLIAAHLHDTGNVFGRQEHERKIAEVINSLGNLWTLDNPETLMIQGIATSHSGYVDDDPTDKDTLRLLSYQDYWTHIPVHSALLASILRFADEISDDRTRGNRFLNDLGVVPDENKIFHEYSMSLSPISIRANVIDFKYYVKVNYVHERIPLGNGESKYLYDEILKRLKKCLCELEYCRKYADGLISTTKLNAEVNIMPEEGRNPVKTTDITLSIKGYPLEDEVSFDTLEFEDGESLNSAITEG